MRPRGTATTTTRSAVRARMSKGAQPSTGYPILRDQPSGGCVTWSAKRVVLRRRSLARLLLL